MCRDCHTGGSGFPIADDHLTHSGGRRRLVGRHGRVHGFTLIELLVVISIIALLIAILLPTLKTARATARMIGCLSNERQIGLLLFSYSSDHRGVIPPTIRSVAPGSAGLRYWAQSLNAHLGADITANLNGMFQCPEYTLNNNWKLRGNYGLNQVLAMGTSTAYRDANSKLSYDHNGVASTQSHYYVLDKTLSPSRVYLSSDGDANLIYYMPTFVTDIPGILRHLQRTNVLFADGSAKTKKTLVDPVARYQASGGLPWLNKTAYASTFPETE